MTKALSFTKASLNRRIAAAIEAGLSVTGIAPDGTILTGPKPDEKAQDNDAQPRKVVRL